MSGMTITSSRSYRVAFATPYLRSGQLFLVRLKDAWKFSDGIYSLMGNKPKIGVIAGTTGDLFISKTINRAVIERYPVSEKAVEALINKEIDVFSDYCWALHCAGLAWSFFLASLLDDDLAQWTRGDLKTSVDLALLKGRLHRGAYVLPLAVPSASLLKNFAYHRIII